MNRFLLCFTCLVKSAKLLLKIRQQIGPKMHRKSRDSCRQSAVSDVDTADVKMAAVDQREELGAGAAERVSRY